MSPDSKSLPLVNVSDKPNGKKKSFVRVPKPRLKPKSSNLSEPIKKPLEAEIIDVEFESEPDESHSFQVKTHDILNDEIQYSTGPIVLSNEDNTEKFEITKFESNENYENIEENALVVVSGLQRYLTELRKYPLLTPYEEKDLAIKSFENEDIAARNRLVTANLRLVVKIAMEYRRAYSQMLDLIQEGNAGLVQAVNRFNPYRGVKLSTYSAWWIRAYILKFLMDNKSLVRMGTTDAQRKLFFRLRSEAEKLYALTQKFDANALADTIGVKEQDVVEMHQRLSAGDTSLDTPISEDGETRLIDFLVDDEENSLEKIEKKQLLEILSKKVQEVKSDLNERDLYIFNNRILSDDPVTLQDVGQKFGITRERARQLEVRVLNKIRSKLV